jgi:hypothetical protein
MAMAAVRVRSGIGVGLALGSSLAVGVLFLAIRLMWQPEFSEQGPFEEGERVLKQGRASYSPSWDPPVFGWLYLTNTRLLFLTRRLSFAKHTVSIPFREIGQVETKKTLGLVRNILRVETVGPAATFMVGGACEWQRAIKAAQEAALTVAG